jgi:copper chaperone CopZ
VAQKVLDISGMTCDHCVRAVRAELGALPGVSEVTVDLAAGQATIEADPVPAAAALREAVEAAGYELAG